VAQIIYSPQAIDHLERAIAFLWTEDRVAAVAAASAIREAVAVLASHPLIGRRYEGEIRELVISHGKTGYLALYRYIAAKDEVRVLAIRHQRELDYPV
jgi:plasmid stabilization system protein ParE